jgi:phosphoserine aminotransferase
MRLEHRRLKMSTVVNFSAGPTSLVPEVEEGMERARKGLFTAGISLEAESHRHPKFVEIIQETTNTIRRLLEIPDEYEIVFVNGSMSSQYKYWLLNLINPYISDYRPTIGYVDSGYWGYKATTYGREIATKTGLFKFIEVASSRNVSYRNMPDLLNVNPQNMPLDFIHVVSNETVNGTQLRFYNFTENWEDVNVVADMSSDIMSRCIPIEKFGLIYAGTQKNLGVPGTLVLVIVRKDLLPKEPHPLLGSSQSYDSQMKNHWALSNTPPMLALYSVYLVSKWVEEQGGISEMMVRAHKRAELLYNAIDTNESFCRIVPIRSQSNMNIIFKLANQEKHDEFIDMCKSAGLHNLNGHRSAVEYWGPHIRASNYNCMTLEGMYRLVQVMNDFRKKHS